MSETLVLDKKPRKLFLYEEPDGTIEVWDTHFPNYPYGNAVSYILSYDPEKRIITYEIFRNSWYGSGREIVRKRRVQAPRKIKQLLLSIKSFEDFEKASDTLFPSQNKN